MSDVLKWNRIGRDLRAQWVQFPDFKAEDTGIKKYRGDLLKATQAASGSMRIVEKVSGFHGPYPTPPLLSLVNASFPCSPDLVPLLLIIFLSDFLVLRSFALPPHLEQL